MKDFLKMLAAVFCGSCLLRILGFFTIIGIVTSLATSAKDNTEKIESGSVLRFNIETPITERTNALSSSALMQIFNNNTQPLSVSEFCAAVEAAATDDRILGISLEGSTANASLANLRTMRQALNEFRLNSEKPVFYHGTTSDQKAVYLASIADSLFVSPEGSVEMFGISATQLFYKQLINKIDANVEVIRHGKYKSAGEPFLRDNMSAEARQQLSECVDTLWNVIRTELAFARNITPEAIDDYVNKMDFSDAQKAVDCGIIDGAIYADEYNQKLKSAFGLSPKAKLELTQMNNYVAVNVAAKEPVASFAPNQIAIVYANGEIMDGSNPLDASNIYATDLCNTLAQVRTDNKIKAAVLRIDSPGGSALASDVIWREVKLLAEEKPVVVSMGEYAASGGYYIACAANTILSDPTTLTGSIGVFGIVPCGEKTLKNLGITTDGVSSHTDTQPNMYKPLTTKQRRYYEGQIERIYSTFVSRVAEGRNLSVATVDSIAQGRVWSGIDAVRLGLVDDFGTLSDAIDVAAELAKVSNYTVTEIPNRLSQFQQILSSFGAGVSATIKGTPLGQHLGILESTQELLSKPQMRAETAIKVEM